MVNGVPNPKRCARQRGTVIIIIIIIKNCTFESPHLLFVLTTLLA